MAEIGKDLHKAKHLLESGELVAIPTETVYGLAANALDEQAVSRIFQAKNRPQFDPLIIHLADRYKLEEYCDDIPDDFYNLYEALSPGPITFVLKKKQVVPDLVTAGHQTVAVRFPNHSLSLDLLNSIDFPLAAPSANPFGYVSPTSAEHVNDQLGSSIAYILDGGPCEVGLESTIVDLSYGGVSVLRLGGVSIEEIETILRKKIGRVLTSSSNPKAPGMLSTHYSPGKKILFGDLDRNFKIFQGTKIGSISFHKQICGIPLKNQWILSPAGDLREAAANLFRCLRETDKTDLEVILAEKFPEEGLGRAINDRLMRAAAE